jgi:hypothetical protein
MERSTPRLGEVLGLKHSRVSYDQAHANTFSRSGASPHQATRTFELAFTSLNRRQFRPEERVVWRGKYERFCQHLCSTVIGIGGIEK